jgi:hypothetical protein
LALSKSRRSSDIKSVAATALPVEATAAQVLFCCDFDAAAILNYPSAGRPRLMEYLLIVLVLATVLALGAAYGSLAATMYVMQRTVRVAPSVARTPQHAADRRLI